MKQYDRVRVVTDMRVEHIFANGTIDVSDAEGSLHAIYPGSEFRVLDVTDDMADRAAQAFHEFDLGDAQYSMSTAEISRLAWKCALTEALKEREDV